METRREFIGESFAFGAAAYLPLELKAQESVKTSSKAKSESKDSTVPKTFLVPIIKCDVPSSINRIYPAKAMKEAIDKIKDKDGNTELLGTLGLSGFPVRFTDVAFRVNDLVIKNMQGMTVCAAITMLDTPQGKIAKNLMQECLERGNKIFDEFSFRPSGTGQSNVDDDGHQVVGEYNLCAINMLPTQESSQFNVQHMPKR
jgi:hypothetical protein